ncbi:hypothetical protein [Adhaeribacter radiodurans]|nr:hypothetical protein [Adhaeribacter radiodurans]
MAGRPRLASSRSVSLLSSLRCGMSRSSAPEDYKALKSQTGVNYS